MVSPAADKESAAAEVSRQIQNLPKHYSDADSSSMRESQGERIPNVEMFEARIPSNSDSSIVNDINKRKGSGVSIF